MTAPVIPTSAAELEEMLGDDSKLRKIYDGGNLGEFITNYVEATAKRDTGIGQQVLEAHQAAMADLYRSQDVLDKDRLDLTNGKRGDAVPASRSKAYSAKASGAALDGLFAGTEDLFSALFQERNGVRAGVERMHKIRNDYSTVIPSEGGFLVPEEFRAELLKLSLEDGVVRSRARVIPMASPRIKFPMIDSTSNVSSVYGGVVGYWTEEAAALAASSARFGAIALDANKLTAYAEIPNELIQDSAISVGAFVDQLFPEAIRWFEDTAFISGTGAGQPLGFLNAPCSVSVTRQTASTVKWVDIVGMYARMLPTSLSNAVWIINQEVLPQLLQLTLPVKNVAGTENVGGSAVGIDYSQGAGAPQMTLLGRPIVVTEKVPALGTAGDVNFVDLGYYLVGDRQQVTAMTSEHFKFNLDSTAYRVVERVDGKPWLQSAITPAKGSNSLSPFLKLA